MRRAELWLAAGVVVLLALAAFAGRRDAPTTDLDDPRASVQRAGPHGAKGLAETLRRLGIQVRLSRRPLIELVRAPSRAADAHAVHALLDIYVPPEAEIAAVREFVARGGRVFVVGYTGIERCFGYASRYLGTDRWETLEDPVSVAAPEGITNLPGTRRIMERLPAESLFARESLQATPPPCEFLPSVDREVLLATTAGQPVAVALQFAAGGRAILVADVAFVTNRSLRETDAGLLVVSWLMERGVRRVIFDEFHQGFGAERTVWHLASAAIGWLATQPVGWAVLQLLGVGIVALVILAVRFGPVTAGVERRRRSPAEHVEALAAGLRGAGGGGAKEAVRLLVGGLRRRLSRTGRTAGPGDDWLAALELALPAQRGRSAARRLRQVVERPPPDNPVVAAAQAVEDVWEELRPRTTRG